MVNYGKKHNVEAMTYRKYIFNSIVKMTEAVNAGLDEPGPAKLKQKFKNNKQEYT